LRSAQMICKNVILGWELNWSFSSTDWTVKWPKTNRTRGKTKIFNLSIYRPFIPLNQLW
jgi:hypothetical protein